MKEETPRRRRRLSAEDKWQIFGRYTVAVRQLILLTPFQVMRLVLSVQYRDRLSLMKDDYVGPRPPVLNAHVHWHDTPIHFKTARSCPPDGNENGAPD